jgi:hypothetical protein
MPRRESRNQTVSDLVPRINLPRSDFPIFEGDDPTDWVAKCQYFFDLYQVSEGVKTRLEVFN